LASESEVRFWVGFHLIPGVGSATLLALRDAFGTLGEAWHASPADLRAVGLSEKAAGTIAAQRRAIDIAAGEGGGARSYAR
jgi:DNA processing protein